MKPCIVVKIGTNQDFYPTHIMIGTEIRPSGEIMYCVVGCDANNGIVANLYGSTMLDRAISKLAELSNQLARVMAEADIEKWKKEQDQ